MKKFLSLLLLAVSCFAQEPLTTLNYSIVGSYLKVSPATVAVPKGIAGSIRIEVANADGAAKVLDNALTQGAYVEAILRSATFPARRLIGEVNAPLMLPALNVTGDYQLDNIRLVDAATGQTRLEGLPGNVPVRVFEEILVSRVTSRPLSLSEIQEKGIVIDEQNFRAVEFEVGFVLDGRTIPVKFPVVTPDFQQSTEIIPAAELEKRLVEAQMINSELAKNGAANLPDDLKAAGLNLQIRGANFEVAEVKEKNLRLGIPPIPALMVIPGNIGYLNQFFSVQIFTENAAPVGSGLSVFNLQAKLVLPAGADLIPSESYQNPGDDPLRFARVGTDKIIQPLQAIVRPGPDGVAGTPDDIARLQPKEVGQAEFLVEGLKEGLHVMDLELSGELDGLAAGSVKIKGRAAGSVLVRNPKFSLAFSHPATVRTGEPYDAYITILNTSQVEANLLSVTLPRGSISGGQLESSERVELGNVKPGQTVTAKFRIRAQRTGRITFSNLTTSEDSVIGRFRLRMGVDERGVELSPDTIGYPAYANRLPETVFDAANRVLGQALSVATAPLLPPGIKPVPYTIIEKRVLELAEAGQRLAYGDATNKVLFDLLLDFHGGRSFNDGFDQIMRTTDAGRELRDAFAVEFEKHDNLNSVERLAERGSDLAGRGEAWVFAAASHTNIAIAGAVAAGARGRFNISLPTNAIARWTVTQNVEQATLSLTRVSTNGTASSIIWTLSNPPIGSCYTYSLGDGGAALQVDYECDGLNDTSIPGIMSAAQETVPQLVSVRQVPEIVSTRPFPSCIGAPADNYATVLAVLFSKPMTQTNANIPSAYRLDNGIEAQSIRVQPGGRVALLNLKQGIGAVRPRTMTVHGVKDVRGNIMVSNNLPVLNLIKEGVAVNGRVFRADGSAAANVPVTLTMNDVTKDPFDRCEPEVISKIAQVFTDANGGFSFDFIVAGVGYTISATDTGGLPVEAIQAILNSSRGNTIFDRERFAAQLVQTNILNSLGVATASEAIALAENLDRAVWNDVAFYEPGAMGREITVALRFRGRAVVTGKVVGPDGVTPVVRAAVNLFPDPTSRELGRGIFTDVNGNFQFNGVPLGDFSLQVKSGIGQFRTLAGKLNSAGEISNLLVVLAAPTPEQTVRTALHGMVTEPDNIQPHPKASVFLRNSQGRVVAALKADMDGFWEAADIPTGSYEALAISIDGRRKGIRSGAIAAQGVTNFVQVALNGTGIVTGRVESSTGQPVANALVAGGQAIVRTDANGLFTLTGVPLGTRAIDAGLESIYAPNHFPRFGAATVNVLPGVENFVVVRLRPAGVITGKVTDANKNPVTGIKVSIPVPGGFAWAKVNENGIFKFINMPPGEYIVSAPAPPVTEPPEELLEQIENGSQDELIAAVTEAFTTYSGVNNPSLGGTNQFTPGEWGYTSATILADGDVAVADVKYFPKGNVTGTVLNHQGVPIGARVRLTGLGPQEDGSPGILIRGEMNSDPALGTFGFTNRLMIGDWAVQTASPFYAVVLSEIGRTTDFHPHVTNLVLKFPNRKETHGRLAGRVFYPDGQIVGEGVKVKTFFGPGIENTTDTNGVFRNLFDINQGSYRVEAQDNLTGLKGQAMANVVAGQTNYVEVHLAGLGAAEIAVLQASGLPASNAEVELSQGGFPDEKRVGRTDGNGVFRAEGLPAGKYSFSVKFTTPAAVLRGRAGLDVVYNQTTTTNVTLGATGTITGTFRSRGDGSPIGAARVAIGNLAYAPTAIDGSFTITGIPLGVYRIVAIDPVSGRKGIGEATLSFQDQTVAVNLVEQNLGELRGQLFEAGGTNGVAAAQVRFVPKDSLETPRTVTTGPEGAFYFPAVAAGPFTLQASGPIDTRNASASGTFPADGSSLVLNLVLPAKPVRGRITVQVRNPDGSAAPSARVFASGSASGGNADTDSSGIAIIDNLSIGSVQLRANSLLPTQSNSRGETNIVLFSTLADTNATVQLSGVGAVKGKVFKSDGSAPADFANVKAQFLTHPFNGATVSTVTDDQGDFVIGNVPMGAYRLVAEQGSLAVSTNGSILSADQTNIVQLTLGASGGVVGRLLRADGTTVVTNNNVLILFGSQNSAEGNAVAQTGSDGRFAFTNVPLGKVTVQASVLRVNGLAKAGGTLSVNGGVLDLGDIILDEDLPTIVKVSPANNASGIPIATVVDITFHEAMDPATVNNNTNAIYLRTGANIVRSTVSLVAHPSDNKLRVIRIAPLSPLKSLATYEVVVINGERRNAGGAVIADGPRDLVGRAQAEPLLATFTTRDDDPPLIFSVFPANNATQIGIAAVPRISFTEPVAPTGIHVALNGPSGLVAGHPNLSSDGRILTFSSIFNLTVNSTYTLTVSNVFDLANNRLVGDPLSVLFQTEDTLGPEIAELKLKQSPVAGVTVTLEATLVSAEAGATVHFKQNGQSIGIATGSSYTVQATIPAAGPVRFEAIASDRYGNSGEVKVKIVDVVSNQPPTLQLTLLTNTPVASGKEFTFNLSATDDVAVTNVTVVGVGSLPFVRNYTNAITTNLTFTVPSTALSGKTIQIRAQATDSLGAVSEERLIEVEVLDKAAPSIAILKPSSSAVLDLNQPLPLQIRASDNSSNLIVTTSFISPFLKTFTNTIPILPNLEQTNTLSLSLQDAPRGGGSLQVTVNVRDDAGNEASVSRIFTMPDLVIPTIDRVSPTNNAPRRSLWTQINYFFSETVDEKSIIQGRFELTNNASIQTPFVHRYFGDQIRIDPALPLAPGVTYTNILYPGLTDRWTNLVTDVNTNAIPVEGLATTFITAAILGTFPEDNTKLIASQSFNASAQFEAGLGATSFRFEVEGLVQTNVFVSASATNAIAILKAPLLAGSTTLNILALPNTVGPNYLVKTIALDIRSREADDDGDGWSNGYELDRGMNPFQADSPIADFDSDGLSNGQEQSLGTDPARPDTDNDGLLDGAEIIATTDPLNPDTDGDGILDGVDPNPLEGALGIVLNIPTNIVLLEGESTNINFSVASSNAVLASVQFSKTNPPPLYANLTNIVILNTATNGVASGTLLLQPQSGDAGTAVLTLVAAGHEGTNAVSGFANISVTVQPAALAVTRWKDPVSGNWNDPARWTDGVPSTTKPGAIDMPGDYIVTLNSDATVGDLSIGADTGEQTLALTNRTFTVTRLFQAKTNSKVIMASGARLSGPGQINIAGRLTWIGGGMVGSGGTTLAEGSRTTISGTEGKYVHTRILNNAGEMIWTGNSSLTIGLDGVLNNSGLVDLQGNGSIFNAVSGFRTPSTFNNTGTLLKSGAGASGVASSFNNNGAVTVQGGTLEFSNGGLGAGRFNVLNSTILRFDGGIHTLSLPARVEGSGALEAATGGVNFSGALELTGPLLINADFHLLPGARVSPRDQITINNSGHLRFSSSQTIVINVITNRGELTGFDLISVTNRLTWLGGTISGTNLLRIAPAAALEMSSAAQKTLSGRRLENAGSAYWTNATFWNIADGAVFTNSGTLDFRSDVGIFSILSGSPNIGSFENGGVLKKSFDTGMVSFALPFRNSGVAVIESGGISLERDDESSGEFNISSNAFLRFSSGIHHLTDASRIQGAGEARFAFGTVNMAGRLTAPVVLGFSSPTLNLLTNVTITNYMNFTNGWIAGPGNLIIKGSLNHYGGIMAGTGSTVVEPGGEAIFLVGSGQSINRPFENRGLSTFKSPSNVSLGNIFRNLGTAKFEGGGSVTWNSGSSPFINEGQLIKSGPGILQFGYKTVFENRGEVEILSGALDLGGGGENSGVIHVVSPGALTFGTPLTHTAASRIYGNGSIDFNSGDQDLLGRLEPSGPISMRSGRITIHNTLAPFLSALSINGATVQFEAPQRFSNLSLQIGNITGSADVAVSDSFVWSSGQIQSGGRLIIETNATASIVPNANGRTLMRQLDNFGLLSIDDFCYVQTGAALNNHASGTVELRNKSLYWNGGAPLINNAGVIKKLTTNQFSIDQQLRLNNVGLINVIEGALTLPSGTNSGSILVSNDTALSFGGSMTHAPGSTISGPGFIHFASGTHDLLGTFSPQGELRFSGFSTKVALKQPIAPAGVVTNSGAEVTFNAPQSFANFVFNGGKLLGPGDLAFTQSIFWSGGEFSGGGRVTIATNATLTATTANSKRLERSFDNHGVANFADNMTIWASNTTWSNKPGSVMNFPQGAYLSWNGGTALLDNLGTINKAGTNRLDLVSVRFQNSGVLNIDEGLMSLNGGTNNGAIQISTNASLELASGTFALAPGTAFSGSGNLHILNSTILRLETDVNFKTLQVLHTSVNAPQGAFILANEPGGSLAFGRNLTLPVSLVIGGTLATTVSNITLTINGDLFLAAGSLVDNPGSIQVKGNYVDQGAIIPKNPPVKIGALSPVALNIKQSEASAGPEAATKDFRGGLEITWDSAPGKQFQVEASQNLIQWQHLSGVVEEILPGRYRASINAERPHSFYRVIAE